MPRKRSLFSLLKWLAVILILRVLLTILRNYPGYFPADFRTLFLQGREHDFPGLYAIAFYTHIITAPMVLVFGLFLLSERARRWSWRIHRNLGRVQAWLILIFVVPSSVVMSHYAYAGPAAGLSFFFLSVATAMSTLFGVYHAWKRQIHQHREWMDRGYVLLSSAVILRLISGAAIVLEVEKAEEAYILATWSSWLIPLGLYELWRLSGWRLN
jgi:uncharacterized membrane protein